MFEENKSLFPKSLVIAIIFALGVFADRVFIKFTNQTIEPSQSASLSEIVDMKEDENDEKNGNLFLVKKVLDGDTIEIENGERVRYIGVDAPEKNPKTGEEECFGKESLAKNKSLIEGKKVRLVKDASEKDRYGRLLRYVYLNNTFINLELIQEGFAKATAYPPDIKFKDVFKKAENQAKKENKGFWRECQPA